MKSGQDESRLIGTRVVGDRRVNEVFYPGGMQQDHHRHHLASLSLVTSGRYRECVGRQTHSRGMSTLIYHPAGEKHAVTFESDVRILSIEFGRSGSANSILDNPDRGSSHRSELIAWLGARLEREM